MSIVIDPRFCGPDGSGNGGYVSGLLGLRSGAHVGGPGAVVTLRTPPPLGVAMAVVADSEGIVALRHGDLLVAEAARASAEFPVVVAVAPAEAEAAQARYPGLTTHPFPRCFVCGPDRAVGEGMRLSPGRLADGSRRTACIWQPDPSLADAGGRVLPEFVWAALDCPGGWSAEIEGRPMVLGRMAARVGDAPSAGEECVVMGQLLGESGRKTFTASTVYGSDGRELGRAQATWIAVAT